MAARPFFGKSREVRTSFWGRRRLRLGPGFRRIVEDVLGGIRAVTACVDLEDTSRIRAEVWRMKERIVLDFIHLAVCLESPQRQLGDR